MSDPVKIFIVEDHDLFREGISFVLNADERFEVIGAACNGKEFIEVLPQINPNIVLMDIAMPIMNGIEATTKAIQIEPNLKIIALSLYNDQENYLQMIDAGVKGFVLKDAGKEELQRAIDLVNLGGNFFSQELLMNIIRNKSEEQKESDIAKTIKLSDRELEILHLLCKAYTNKQIADALFLSPKTVEGHKAKLMQKTNTSSSLALVLFAIKSKMVEL